MRLFFVLTPVLAAVFGVDQQIFWKIDYGSGVPCDSLVVHRHVRNQRKRVLFDHQLDTAGSQYLIGVRADGRFSEQVQSLWLYCEYLVNGKLHSKLLAKSRAFKISVMVTVEYQDSRDFIMDITPVVPQRNTHRMTLLYQLQKLQDQWLCYADACPGGLVQAYEKSESIIEEQIKSNAIEPNLQTLIVYQLDMPSRQIQQSQGCTAMLDENPIEALRQASELIRQSARRSNSIARQVPAHERFRKFFQLTMREFPSIVGFVVARVIQIARIKAFGPTAEDQALERMQTPVYNVLKLSQFQLKLDQMQACSLDNRSTLLEYFKNAILGRLGIILIRAMAEAWKPQ